MKNLAFLLHVLGGFWFFFVSITLIVLFCYFSTNFSVPVGVLFQTSRVQFNNSDLHIYQSINLENSNRMPLNVLLQLHQVLNLLLSTKRKNGWFCLHHFWSFYPASQMNAMTWAEICFGYLCVGPSNQMSILIEVNLTNLLSWIQNLRDLLYNEIFTLKSVCT